MDIKVLARGYNLVDGPRWDKSGNLYCADLMGEGVFKLSPDGVTKKLSPSRKWVGGLVLNRDGGVICSGYGGLLLLDEESGTARTLLAKVESSPLDSINDIEADSQGSIYGGTIDYGAVWERNEEPQAGVLFRLDPCGRVTVLREGIKLSNGIAFSPDGGQLYHSESSVGIRVYDIGRDRGLRNAHLFAALTDSDGIVVDIEGGLWVARWQSSEILRFRPDGVLDLRLALPGFKVTSLAFGGADLMDLYVTTMSPDRTSRDGGVILLRSEIPGLAAAYAQFPKPNEEQRNEQRK